MNNHIFRNIKLTNRYIYAIGIIFILIGVIIKEYDIISVVLLSIGTSVFSSSLVASINREYLIQQSNATSMLEEWGLIKIYRTRTEINPYTNQKILSARQIDICAMGLKSLRDAQGNTIKDRVTNGMGLRILTIDPDYKMINEIDLFEGKKEGATKDSIVKLIAWVEELKKCQIRDNQVEIRTYKNFPYEHYFYIDGEVFVGPYESKTSQQVITYRYKEKSNGADMYRQNFETLWEQAG